MGWGIWKIEILTNDTFNNILKLILDILDFRNSDSIRFYYNFQERKKNIDIKCL